MYKLKEYIQVEHSGMYFLTLLFIRERIKICFKSLYKNEFAMSIQI